MSNYCINLKKKVKKGETYFYCCKKGILEKSFFCSSCLDKEYKKTPKNTLKTSHTLTTKKPMNKISKKREFVSKKTYREVFERCNEMCVICGKKQDLHLHHIDGRGKGKTDNPDNCVMLCSYCHLEVVHKNNKYWRKKLKEMI